MAAKNATRLVMEDYFKNITKDSASLAQQVMLDSNAAELDNLEQPEVMSMLPDIANKDIVDLAAGIGRFTGEFVKSARSVLAVDFMEVYVQKNKEEHGHHGNARFIQTDVRDLTLPDSSVDVVFSNWLLMYLADDEVMQLAARVLRWLRPGGHFFFRESCYHSSGNMSRSSNPTKYREPSLYTALMQQAQLQTDDGESYCLETIFTRPVQAYIKMKGNAHQLCWLMHKSKQDTVSAHGFHNFQEFLDKQQYSRTGILRYERIFGRNFVSTGGLQTTRDFVRELDIRPGQTVLDVGCGIGGSALYMAEEYQARVLGIDLSVNMIDIAYDRAAETDKHHQVVFEVGDATKRDFAPESFDVIYSRDTILHIADKKSLFTHFLRWLRPGGKLLITDYCCTEDTWTDAYRAYVTQRGYNLLSPRQYGQVLEAVGFTKVRALDKTDRFVSCLKAELEKFEPMQEDFVKEFSQKDYDDIVNGWNDKLVRCASGNQRWGLFYAEKKLN